MKLLSQALGVLIILGIPTAAVASSDPDQPLVGTTVQEIFDELNANESNDKFKSTLIISSEDSVKIIEVKDSESTLGKLFQEANLPIKNYRTERDLPVDPSDEVQDRQNLFFFAVNYDAKVEEISLPFVTEYLESSSIPKGETETLQEGVKGRAFKTIVNESSGARNATQNKSVTESDDTSTTESVTIIEPPKPKKILRGAGDITTPIDLEAIPLLKEWPVPGTITSEFGMRKHPITGEYKLHDGVDLSSACGTPIKAAYDGIIVKAEYAGGYGERIELDHGAGFVTSYSHLTSFEVEEGERVSKGDTIGLVGSTGYSTGCHLHFMIEIDDKLYDPEEYFRE